MRLIQLLQRICIETLEIIAVFAHRAAMKGMTEESDYVSAAYRLCKKTIKRVFSYLTM